LTLECRAANYDIKGIELGASHDFCSVEGRAMAAAKRPLSVALVSLAVIAGVQVVGIQTAAADAGGHASCAGLEVSSISPPGSSDEFPGGVRELMGAVHGLATALNTTPGAIVSTVAHLHEGSHAACDEATE
jgi:hypothetical protein